MLKTRTNPYPCFIQLSRLVRFVLESVDKLVFSRGLVLFGLLVAFVPTRTDISGILQAHNRNKDDGSATLVILDDSAYSKKDLFDTLDSLQFALSLGVLQHVAPIGKTSRWVGLQNLHITDFEHLYRSLLLFPVPRLHAGMSQSWCCRLYPQAFTSRCSDHFVFGKSR